MTKITLLPTIAAALLACGLSATPAAALGRTWVSGTGSDSNPCTRTAPCQSFAHAITLTSAGGEIDVLDPAGYGALTIDKAISIVNDGGGVAGIGISSGNAITINAGASDSVHLRGLTIDGRGGGTNGILFNTGGNLAIENCVVRNFTVAGINISPSTSSSFSVSNTIASNNSGHGILIRPTGAAVVTGMLSRVITNDNSFDGIIVTGLVTTGASLNVTIVDSEASNNSAYGVLTSSLPGHAATAVMLRNVVASNNGFGLGATGLGAGANAILRVAHSVVKGNGTGVSTIVPGILNSYGDNDIDGNTSDNTGILTPLAMH